MLARPMNLSQFLGFGSTPFLVLLLLAGCIANNSDAKEGALSSGDTLSAGLSVGRGNADSSKQHLAGAHAEYRDSAEVFDPDGYYIPTEPLKIDGQLISSLQLHTVDFFYGGQLHYERPKIVQPPEVVISISDLNGANSSNHQCVAGVIAPDSLSVRCLGTSVGDVTIDGHFLDKSGWYWNRIAFENTPTELLVARVVVTRGGRVTRDAVRRFTYTTGD